MVPIQAENGAVTQCLLKAHVATGSTGEMMYENYSGLVGVLDIGIGTFAMDDATGQAYVFVDVSNPNRPVLSPVGSNQRMTYDAKHETWVLPQLQATSSQSANMTSVSSGTSFSSSSSSTPLLPASNPSANFSSSSLVSDVVALQNPKSSQGNSSSSSATSGSQSNFVKHAGTFARMPSQSPFSPFGNAFQNPSSSSASSDAIMDTRAMVAPKTQVPASNESKEKKASSTSSSSSSSSSSAASAIPEVTIQYSANEHFKRHLANNPRGQAHSVFIGGWENVLAITAEVAELLKARTATWNTKQNSRQYSFDLKRIIGFQGEAEGQRNQYPMTTHVEGYYTFKIKSDGERVIFIETAYPGPPYNQGTLDANGYKLNGKNKPVKK